jgi:hypothetical protein
MAVDNVPHDEWLALLRKSSTLLSNAEHASRVGNHRRAAEIWGELRPLNFRIRQLAALPSTRDTWPKRMFPLPQKGL